MAYGGLNKWTTPWKLETIPRVSSRFSLSVEHGQADGGRDDRIRLPRPDSQARTGTGNKTFSMFS